MGRVRTKTVKKASRNIIEKYYSKLTLDFDTNKRVTEEVAIIQSKRLRNKIAGFTTHLMKRIQRGPVRGISLKLQEEERERRMDYVPEESAVNTEAIEVDADTLEMLRTINAGSLPGVKEVQVQTGGGVVGATYGGAGGFGGSGGAYGGGGGLSAGCKEGVMLEDGDGYQERWQRLTPLSVETWAYRLQEASTAPAHAPAQASSAGAARRGFLLGAGDFWMLAVDRPGTAVTGGGRLAERLGALLGSDPSAEETVKRVESLLALELSYGRERPRQQAAQSGFANQLEALKSMSTVVADTGEIGAIRDFKPIDCTTNPSLVLKAVKNEEYKHYIDEAVAMERSLNLPTMDPSRPYANIADILAVNIGALMLDVVPGRVSTECDAHLSLDTQATIDKGLRIVDLYAKKGIEPSRLYIKIASTWEGIRACEALQKQGINCNMTLLFSFAQAAACADAGAALISPFVGRIMDWYKKKEGRDFAPHEDPGVASVKRIYAYYKEQRVPTIVMAASFRNVGEIRELAGCDNITISPALLGELAASTEPLPRKLWPEMGGGEGAPVDLSASQAARFAEMHGGDQMAVEKLAEGIQSFSKDQEALEQLIAALKG
ncbi:hypothetical protein WJX81_002241 [Elliptochloris bilobata]|uniref:Transaldolase n=1 Tax=Elliptochloris bilobata TaxID=381761 RepID=A0AAW1R1L4_9CHLO